MAINLKRKEIPFTKNTWQNKNTLGTIGDHHNVRIKEVYKNGESCDLMSVAYTHYSSRPYTDSDVIRYEIYIYDNGYIHQTGLGYNAEMSLLNCNDTDLCGLLRFLKWNEEVFIKRKQKGFLDHVRDIFWTDVWILD